MILPKLRISKEEIQLAFTICLQPSSPISSSAIFILCLHNSNLLIGQLTAAKYSHPFALIWFSPAILESYEELVIQGSIFLQKVQGTLHLQLPHYLVLE